jgi:hypothetical protein
MGASKATMQLCMGADFKLFLGGRKYNFAQTVARAQRKYLYVLNMAYWNVER